LICQNPTATKLPEIDAIFSLRMIGEGMICIKPVAINKTKIFAVGLVVGILTVLLLLVWSECFRR